MPEHKSVIARAAIEQFKARTSVEQVIAGQASEDGYACESSRIKPIITAAAGDDRSLNRG